MNVDVIHNGEALKVLSDRSLIAIESVHTCITSPPYWGLRDYLIQEDGRPPLGQETEPIDYINRLVTIFDKVGDVLRDEGTLWVVIGDSYAGSGKTGGTISHKQFGKTVDIQLHGLHGIVPDGCKPKDLIGIPWMFAFAMRENGWYLRQDIIWHKPNPMPNPVRDRCTSSHEYVFLFSKSQKYYYDADSIKTKAVDTRDRAVKFGGAKYDSENSTNSTYSNRTYTYTGKANKRDVWTVPTAANGTIHKAPYPLELIRPMVLAGCPPDGIVLDPFMGSGTTGIVAKEMRRHFIGVEINPEFATLARKRCGEASPHSYLERLRKG